MMVPHAEPLQPDPERLHVTAVFAVPVTVALNWRCAPAITFAEVGETETNTAATIVAVAFPDFVVSAFEVAVTVTAAGLGIAAGAV